MKKILQRIDGTFFKKYDAGSPVWTDQKDEAMRLSDTDSLMVTVLEQQAIFKIINET